MQNALKLIDQSGRVGGYLVVWGNPAQKDLQGEFFTPETELGLDWYTQRPMLYHHGLDGTMKSSVIGVINNLKADATGVWAEAQLNLRNKYVETVLKLIEQGILGWSSGSLPHLVEVAADGKIKRWPIVEGSATPTPAEPRRTGISTIKSAYAALGLDTTRLEVQTPTAENTSHEDTPSLKELAAKAALEFPDGETAEEGRPPVEAQPISVKSNDTVGGVTVNMSDLIASVFAALTAMGVQVTPEQQEAITQQVMGSVGQDATMSAMVTEGVPNEQIPAVAKSVSALVNAEVAKLTAAKKQQAAVIADAAKAAFVAANAGQGGVSKVSGFQPTDEQKNPSGIKTNIVNMSDRRFDHLSASDMALAYQMLTEKGRPVSDEFVVAMAYKTAQLVERGDKAANTLGVKSCFPFLKANDVFQADHKAIKSNEVMGVSQNGYGSNYANTYFSADVWEVVRQETLVYDAMLRLGMDEKQVPDGYKSDTIPLEGADMTWYVGGPAADEVSSSAILNPLYASSKFATNSKAVTLARLSARTYWTKELEEDSIVNIVAEANRKIRQSGKEQIEYILLNGDTETSANTNINTIDGTPGTGSSRPSYLLLDGLAKLPLVTNTASTYNASNTLGDGTFLNLRPLMTDSSTNDGKFAIDPNKIVYFIDNSTYFAMLGILQLKTQDVFRAATLENGTISKIWGTQVIPSAQFALANSNGKVATGTPANNAYGRVLAVRPDQWAARWKSQIEVFTEFDPKTYATTLVAHMRWGLTYRAVGASVIARQVNVAIPA